MSRICLLSTSIWLNFPDMSFESLGIDIVRYISYGSKSTETVMRNVRKCWHMKRNVNSEDRLNIDTTTLFQRGC